MFQSTTSQNFSRKKRTNCKFSADSLPIYSQNCNSAIFSFILLASMNFRFLVSCQNHNDSKNYSLLRPLIIPQSCKPKVSLNFQNSLKKFFVCFHVSWNVRVILCSLRFLKVTANCPPAQKL